jgi:hypothetical protein
MLMIMVSPAYAADSGWDVPFVGQLNGPDGFKAVDFENWVKGLQALLAKSQVKMPDEATAQIARNPFAMPEEFGLYQLQVNDGKVYHVALAMIFRDSKGWFPSLSSYFTDTLPADQTKQLAEINDKIRLGITTMQGYMGQTDFMTLQVLDLKPLERLKETREVVYIIRGRVIADTKGLVSPMFIKGYVLERAGKAVVMVVVTVDSEGAFWENTTDEMMKTMKRTIRFSTSLN